MTLERIAALLPYLAALVVLALSLVTATHAILYKREPRASVSWAVVILLIPLMGAICYLLFGINRIQRRAVSLRRRRRPIQGRAPTSLCTPEDLDRALPSEMAHLAPIARVAEAVTRRPLLAGNRLRPLYNGEEAYPAMLEAIDAASSSVSMLAYIFEVDESGQNFIDAMVRAKKRGVDVRVLIDDVGSGDAVVEGLAAEGLSVFRFHPVLRPWRSPFLNLRNHRKVLVVDGRVGFTGGMNLRDTNLVERRHPRTEVDVHFKLEGPVVAHLQEAFVDDWAFATEEALKGDLWFPDLAPAGDVYARGIPSDPGGEKDALRLILVAAIGCARRRVRIVTPYFLPDPGLIAALNVAALRGVNVEILLPQENDIRLVRWASTAMLWQVLIGGCRVWESPPPFDHSKLVVVDGAWSLLGSANLDPRSLRLNFEFNVEAYDRALAGTLEKKIEEKLTKATPITLAKVDGRPFGIKLRDGLARLFMPYL